MAQNQNIFKKFENDRKFGGSNFPKWTCSLSAIKGVKYRKIMRRSDFIKILFVCVCVCHVCPAHPCGSNPMNLLESFSTSNGVAPEMMLRVMEMNNPRDYSSFMADYRQYNECMRMLHTGYFKRSVDNVYHGRQQGTASLSDILIGSGKRRHKRYGNFRSRSLPDLFSRDSYTDEGKHNFKSMDDNPVLKTETVPEEVLEETLPALLKKLYNRDEEITVILVEPKNKDAPVSRTSRRHNRRRRRNR